MNRRALVLGAAAVTLGAQAASAQTTKLVGILAPGPLRPIASFKQRLKELGWVEGRNIRFEERWGEEDDRRYAAFAAELVGMHADAILTWGTPPVLAAKRATNTVPIIMAAIADPVGVGAVPNLARPGGNITGFSTQNFELEQKRLELLKELVPNLARLAMLGDTRNPYSTLAMKQVNASAGALGIHAFGINVDEAGGLDVALKRLNDAVPNGVLVAAVPALFPYRRQIVEFMAANRIPAVYPFREFAEVGGLIVYATNFDELFRHAADYIDKVLNGTSPATLPVQQAASFELLINLKTAKPLGLTVPQPILARADEVIE